jgi:murein DD-endopeptidase MepM/ murein hydrolase activator NlpD
VSMGDAVGWVGSTGLSTGPHLHLELRVGSRAIDPSPYLLLP